MSTRPKIVVIGGGTGSFTLLSGLKAYTPHITALVNMSDDGGSTGVLRDELGVLPPGDVRQCLVALSDSERLRDLFSYRFDEGSLKGHSFGNMFLAALEKMTGSFAEAVEVASQVLNITGQVEPITLEMAQLMLDDGTTIFNKQYEIGHAAFSQPRPRVWLEPAPKVNPAAVTAIAEADVVVIAPGNMYGSLAPALVVPGVREALQATKAPKVYVCNLVVKPGQTDGFTVSDFATEIERFIGAPCLDVVLYNTRQPDKKLLHNYAIAGELPVAYDAAQLNAAHYRALGLELMDTKPWHGGGDADPLAKTRSYIRHDSEAIARELIGLVHD